MRYPSSQSEEKLLPLPKQSCHRTAAFANGHVNLRATMSESGSRGNCCACAIWRHSVERGVTVIIKAEATCHAIVEIP